MIIEFISKNFLYEIRISPLYECANYSVRSILNFFFNDIP